MSEFPGTHGEQQDAKLSEAEVKLVARLFSDPTYFPVEFRTWLKNYIEGAGITINVSQIHGGAGGRVSLPAGIILPYATGKIAANTLPCDGQAVSRSLYDGLWDAIGTTWGAGDGSTTFNVPDFRDRTLYGIGAVVGLGTDGAAYGARGGPRHHHHLSTSSGFNGSGGGATDIQGSHQHDLAGQGHGARSDINQFQAVEYLGYPGGAVTTWGGDHQHAVSVNVSGTVAVAGDTSGGYAQDYGSHAGVKYAITTGKG